MWEVLLVPTVEPFSSPCLRGCRRKDMKKDQRTLQSWKEAQRGKLGRPVGKPLGPRGMLGGPGERTEGPWGSSCTLFVSFFVSVFLSVLCFFVSLFVNIVDCTMAWMQKTCICRHFGSLHFCLCFCLQVGNGVSVPGSCQGHSLWGSGC